MAEDTHLLGEIFGFFRGANPDWTDQQVLSAGRDLIARWVNRDWLELPSMPSEQGPLTNVDELLPLIDRLGVEASYGIKDLWLGLTPKAYEILNGLALLSNKRMQLTGASVLRNVRYCAFNKSPQLMRGPLDGREKKAASSGSANDATSS